MSSKDYYGVARYNSFIQIYYILDVWFEEKQNKISPISECTAALKHIMDGCNPDHWIENGKRVFPDKVVALCLIHALKTGKKCICEVDEKLWRMLEMKIHELEDLDSDETYISMSEVYDNYFSSSKYIDEECEFVFHPDHHPFLSLEDDDLMQDDSMRNNYEHEDLSSPKSDEMGDDEKSDDEMER